MLLMALPWADVFTTSYDTLLERASRKVIERRYEVLVNESDLASPFKVTNHAGPSEPYLTL